MSAHENDTTRVLRPSPFDRRPLAALMLVTCLFAASCDESTDTGGPYAQLDQLLDERLFDDLSRFVEIQTYRNGKLSEQQVVANLQELRDELMSRAEEFNKGQKVHKLVPFEWKKTLKVPGTDTEQEYWLFGLRLGTGQKKIMLSSHLDTVPPGDNPNWEPFKLKKAQRTYLGKETEFYVGRGSIDDKGPALVAFYVLQSVARRYDGNPKLDNVTLEVLFDTSEETDMSMPRYLEHNPDQRPDLGVVYDASWCISAEKGIERPQFTIKRNTSAPAPQGVWIESLDTPVGPTNQIPDTATAVIRGSSSQELQRFAAEVERLYAEHSFDDPSYRRANLTVDAQTVPGGLVLVTHVADAQHGSAPHENRANGANPLVSLASFLGDLVQKGRLARNEVGEMCRFISWAWGTQVFGERHPALLKRSDDVFKEGNGTTYALTRLQTNMSSSDAVAARLRVDIRYALGHHGTPWDGRTEGFVGGKESTSTFEQVFDELIRQFPVSTGYELNYTTVTVYPPDIRLPEGRSFSRVGRAYLQAMGEPCPARATGGGTDAKGEPNMVAAGALFTDLMGPPINYHGFDEGAPVEDLKRGSHILHDLFVGELENP
ncbi:M20/M25/M40 family metallo-hydrolase [Archangium sp.]|uniref:M20/M25/M40 family metallo-hydrolase n=1 Tax=Archangium sp. TaxID=1872627 RepID=UPI002D27C18E|nr:M20/M25/M40 family metallo-hydrolase [Archangium sp.]HYO52649.1 M20/M25/M40 family metallo-hydrolase [Archangium sp.]